MVLHGVVHMKSDRNSCVKNFFFKRAQPPDPHQPIPVLKSCAERAKTERKCLFKFSQLVWMYFEKYIQHMWPQALCVASV